MFSGAAHRRSTWMQLSVCRVRPRGRCLPPGPRLFPTPRTWCATRPGVGTEPHPPYLGPAASRRGADLFLMLPSVSGRRRSTSPAKCALFATGGGHGPDPECGDSVRRRPAIVVGRGPAPRRCRPDAVFYRLRCNGIVSYSPGGPEPRPSLLRLGKDSALIIVPCKQLGWASPVPWPLVGST